MTMEDYVWWDEKSFQIYDDKGFTAHKIKEGWYLTILVTMCNARDVIIIAG